MQPCGAERLGDDIPGGIIAEETALGKAQDGTGVLIEQLGEDSFVPLAAG
jgi:hypothetical protein